MPLIAVSGVIGCGKSSLVEGLAKRMGATPFYEPLPGSGNFMLEAYYKDPAKYAYAMQTLLLALRFQTYQEAQWRSARGEVCIIDSPITSDRAFLEVQRQCGYIDDMEYRAYEALCSIHYPYLQYPDLQIHIDVPIDVEVGRIKERSRDCESGIDTDYLKKLAGVYSDLIPHLAKIFPVVRVDGTGDKEAVLSYAMEAIEERMEELNKESGWPVYKKNTGYPAAR